MSKLPYLPLYVGDYLADTRQLSLEARGAYTDIIFYTWKTRRFLDDDPKKMCRMLGIQKRQWTKIRDELEPYFDLSDGTFFQTKMDDLVTKTTQILNKKREAGSKGGKAKALKNNKTRLADAKIKTCQSESESRSKYKEAPPPPDFSPIKNWLIEANESPNALFRPPLTEFDYSILMDGLERARKDDPPLGKRVAYLVNACRSVQALGHTGKPEGKEDFTKLKIEKRIRELAKISGWDNALELQEAYRRGEQWAREMIWPESASA